MALAAAWGYLVALGMNGNALAKEPGIGAARPNDIVRCHRGVSTDTSLRLARYVATAPERWLNLQPRQAAYLLGGRKLTGNRKRRAAPTFRGV